MLTVNNIDVTSSPSAEEGEVSEMEIIANYKAENLFDSLEKLNAAEAEAKEKEDILNLADEPNLPELKNMTEPNECVEMLREIEAYQSLLEERLKVANNELTARKNAVKELKDSCIFYSAQYEDVKKVANAYMRYGRRLKTVEKKLSEKMLEFPSQGENSFPCFFLESYSHASSVVCTSSFDHDNTIVSGTSSQISPYSISEKGQEKVCSSDNLKNFTSSRSKISKNSMPDSTKRCKNELAETQQKKLKQSPKPKFSKLAEIFAETISDSEKQMSPESSFTRTSDLKSLNVSNMQNEKIADLHMTTDQQNKVRKNLGINFVEKSSNPVTNILDRLNEKEKTDNDYEIEFLLEESYDTKKAKSNICVKRNMELSLQSKGENICADASEEKLSDSQQPSKICVD